MLTDYYEEEVTVKKIGEYCLSCSLQGTKQRQHSFQNHFKRDTSRPLSK